MTEYTKLIYEKATTKDSAIIIRDFKDNKEKYGYETQAEWIEDQFGDEKLKRGRWRILKHTDGEQFHCLWHQCEKDHWEMSEVCYSNYSEWADMAILPKWRCGGCNAQPPESIVTLWCLLEPDLTTEIVQEALAVYDIEEEEDILGGWGMNFQQSFTEMMW